MAGEALELIAERLSLSLLNELTGFSSYWGKWYRIVSEAPSPEGGWVKI
jgi:hypothetical protein